jgi:lipopolysaccharide/colanic/teichoic acid biosynthesis glycosyltransferase
VIAKRLFDVTLAAALLLAASPLILANMLLIWMLDGSAPLYFAPRVGKGSRDFRMIKLRTMCIDADRIGGASTALGDPRVTPFGRLLRRTKIDELPQLWNVLVGEMSLVGPRPNVRIGGTDRYDAAERRLLDVLPGVTDLASIVFANEGEILEGAADAHEAYDRLIRPAKSRLGLIYVEHRSLALDLRLVWLTLVALVARPRALAAIAGLLERWRSDPELGAFCRREAARRIAA